MRLFKSKEEKREITIKKFWDWFSQNANRYADPDKLSSSLVLEFAGKLGAIHKELVFQFEPNGDPAVLEISADGIKSNFPVVREVVALAPGIAGWKVVAFRQPVRDPEKLTLESDGKSVGLNDLMYVSRSDGIRAHVNVFVPGMKNEDDKFGINAAFVILDAMLGEYVVESKLTVDLIAPMERAPDDARPMRELPDELSKLPGDHL